MQNIHKMQMRSIGEVDIFIVLLLFVNLIFPMFIQISSLLLSIPMTFFIVYQKTDFDYLI